jgi:hypothetical protein
MTPEESEDLENKVSQLKNQVNDMSDSVLKMVDFSCSWEIIKMEYKMENLMNQKMEQLQNYMETMLL